ncbi:MAG TPA: hypothetical protein DCL38_09400 [Lachnospiraceae bacterium]|nr:hypothetical protein [Lachnospiraceae bacterium]
MAGEIWIDNSGAGFSEVFRQIDDLAAENGLTVKQKTQLHLLSEETMELVRNLTDTFKAVVSAAIEDGQFTLELISNGRMDSTEREQLWEIAGKRDRNNEVSGKIRTLLEGRYYDDTGENAQLLEQMGVTMVRAGEVEDEEGAGQETEYVWSMQSYGFMAFDRGYASPETDSDWAEISRSIIANISDDIRIYIFRDHLKLVVVKQLKEAETGTTEWGIDPELLVLKKVPVATSRIQVKMVQLLYGGLARKEKSDDRATVSNITLSCKAAPKGRLGCIVYTPRGREKDVLPAVLFLHGGAFVFPALPYHYRLARNIAEGTGCRVFMPDYDLAPQYKSPTQHEEAFELYEQLIMNAQELLTDTGRIIVLGDSAGGTLCAALCLRLKTEGAGLPAPMGQLLLYPSLDARLQSRSMKLYTDVPVCNARAVYEYYKLCRSKTRETPRDWSSPVEADSLEGMPPTYVETAEFDCLHDDGVLYADRLSGARCDVILNETRGTVHAYDMAKDSRVLKKSMEKRIRFINELLGKQR